MCDFSSESLCAFLGVSMPCPISRSRTPAVVVSRCRGCSCVAVQVIEADEDTLRLLRGEVEWSGDTALGVNLFVFANAFVWFSGNLCIKYPFPSSPQRCVSIVSKKNHFIIS